MFDNQNRFHLSTVKVVFIYLIISILWIAFTDRLLDFLVSDPVLQSRFQTFKGWFFVLATSALLFWLIKRLNRNSNKQLNRIKSMFNYAGVGILHLHEGRIIDSNLTVSKLLGYDIKTLTGRAFVDFIHPNQLNNVENAFESARNKEEGHVTEVHLLKKDGSDMWGELVISDLSMSDKPMQEVIIVDISERRAFEVYTNLLLQLILSVEPAEDFQSALRSVLRNICQELHWEAGFAFTPDQQKDVYHKEVGWHAEGEQLEEFDRLVSGYTFAIGEGLVGTTVESQTAQWVEDLEKDERFKQKKDTTRAGLKSVLSVPVIADQSVIAVLVLFSTRKLPLNNNLMRFFSGIGSEIGDKLARKRQQELLQKIFENIPVMITVYRPDLEDISVNREFESVTGWKNEEIPNIDIFEALYPDKKHQAEVRQFMTNPGKGWKDMEMETKSGKSIQTSWTNIRLSDDTQIGIGWDITRRKEQEEKLKENEYLLREAQRIANFGTYRVDLSTGEAETSEVMNRIFGAEPDEKLNLDKWENMIHPSHKQRILNELDKTIANKSRFDEEYQINRASDGMTRWVHGLGELQLDEDGNPIWLFGTIRDITEEKHAESELIRSETEAREARNILRKTFESLEESVLILDPVSRTIIDCNRGAENIFGYTREELIGYTTEFLHVDERHFLRFDKIGRKELEREGIFRTEFKMRKKSGEIFISDHTVSLVHNHEGDVDRVVSVLQDITERKRYHERSIRSIIEGSEQERKRVAKDLHDGLEQFLTAASLNFESLHGALTKVDKKRMEQFDKGLKQLHHAIEETRRISHNLLPKAIEECGLSHATESLINDLDVDSDVKFSYMENIEDVKLPDSVKLNIYRILQEGLNNALRYSKCDRIDIRLMLENDILACGIQDNGMGFDVNAKRREDSGLGLISMQNRAEVLKGTLTIQSKKNEGTVILAEVPVKNQH